MNLQILNLLVRRMMRPQSTHHQRHHPSHRKKYCANAVLARRKKLLDAGLHRHPPEDRDRRENPDHPPPARDRQNEDDRDPDLAAGPALAEEADIEADTLDPPTLVPGDRDHGIVTEELRATEEALIMCVIVVQSAEDRTAATPRVLVTGEGLEAVRVADLVRLNGVVEECRPAPTAAVPEVVARFAKEKTGKGHLAAVQEAPINYADNYFLFKSITLISQI